MAPILLPGTRQLAEHYRLLAEETGEQVRAGVPGVPDERYRLLWDNIAPWHQLRKMSSRLAGLARTSPARATPTASAPSRGRYDPYEFDGTDPLAWLARLRISPCARTGST